MGHGGELATIAGRPPPRTARARHERDGRMGVMHAFGACRPRFVTPDKHSRSREAVCPRAMLRSFDPSEEGARNAGLWPARGPMCDCETKHMSVFTVGPPKTYGAPRAVWWLAPWCPWWRNHPPLVPGGRSQAGQSQLGPPVLLPRLRSASGHRTPPHVLRRLIRRPSDGARQMSHSMPRNIVKD